ncbi:MAG: FecR domain-containing protein [Chloroflexi bacterium]|nr:FecR domain-containing protein [Chloroflexota bacterium]
MLRTSAPLLLVLALLAACAPLSSTPALDSESQSAGQVFPPVESSPTPDPAIPRSAVLDEAEGAVESRFSPDDDFKAAARGAALPPNSELRTGEDGKAKIKLEPEGTSIRLGPNSHLSLVDLSPSAADARTDLELFFGQIWVVLYGGNLEINTASGLATVRGSMLSVDYSPDSGSLTVTCLEGACSLANDLGVTELVAGQASEVPAPGQPPSPPRPISPEELEEWQREVPESAPAFAPPVPGQPGGGPDTSLIEPVRYSFTNLCWGVWHWEFEGPVNVQIDVAPDTTESGELPPGVYRVRDWDDSGFDSGWYETVGGSTLDVTHDCGDPPSAPPGP